MFYVHSHWRYHGLALRLSSWIWHRRSGSTISQSDYMMAPPQLKGGLVIIHKINKTLGKHCNTIFRSILTTFSSHDLTKKCKKPGHQAIRLQNQIDLICGLKISWKSLYSLVYNSVHTVMKFCVMWDGLSLLHVT